MLVSNFVPTKEIMEKHALLHCPAGKSAQWIGIGGVTVVSRADAQSLTAISLKTF